MGVLFVIIFGVAIGFIASKIKGSGFGLWWDIYLGITGAAFARCIMIIAYFMGVTINRDVIGMNLNSVIVDIVGAFTLIYTAKFFHEMTKLSIGIYNNYEGKHGLSRISYQITALFFSRIKTEFIIKKAVSHT